jgi:hypothetical protein
MGKKRLILIVFVSVSIFRKSQSVRLTPFALIFRSIKEVRLKATLLVGYKDLESGKNLKSFQNYKST